VLTVRTHYLSRRFSASPPLLPALKNENILFHGGGKGDYRSYCEASTTRQTSGAQQAA